MPIDQSTQPAAGTTRRTFLARAAVGGAAAAAGVAAPALGLAPFVLPFASAEDGTTDPIADADYAAFAVPLELAAVQAYELAIETDKLSSDSTTVARSFQSHHQAAATTLTELLGEGATVPGADADLVAQVTGQISGAGDDTALAKVLASVEEAIAATHLAIIPNLRDPITARTAIQIAGVQSQQAAFLGAIAGTSIEELTPIEATTDAAVAYEAPVEATTTTTAD